MIRILQFPLRILSVHSLSRCLRARFGVKLLIQFSRILSPCSRLHEITLTCNRCRETSEPLRAIQKNGELWLRETIRRMDFSFLGSGRPGSIASLLVPLDTRIWSRLCSSLNLTRLKILAFEPVSAAVPEN